MMDFVLALALAAMIEPHVASLLLRVNVPSALNTFALAVGLVLVGWLFSEFLLGGLTFGRFVLGLQPRNADGRGLSMAARLRRATGKLMCLGLTGANPFRPARYDTKVGVVWYSPIAPAKVGPMQEWRLVFRDGSLKGKSSKLSAIPAFKNRNEVRFGRDKGWADVKFGDNDGTVSGRHCVLYVSGGHLYLRDGDGKGKQSTHGTSVDGKQLEAAQSLRVGMAESFHIANIKVDIIR
jgi:hypothetical protein